MGSTSEHLVELIMFDDLDELFSLVTLEEAATAWCNYTSRTHIPGVEDEDPDYWASFLLTDPDFSDDDGRMRQILDLLVDRAPTDEVLEVVGAGPLEDFVKGYTDDRLAWIEQRAAESPRFRLALTKVWIWSLSPDVFARVEQAAGVPLARASADVQLDIVPGDLPGTVHITVNGVTVSELETEPEFVDSTIERLKDSSAFRHQDRNTGPV
jgi:hypothetical protein